MTVPIQLDPARALEDTRDNGGDGCPPRLDWREMACCAFAIFLIARMLDLVEAVRAALFGARPVVEARASAAVAWTPGGAAPAAASRPIP